MAAKKLPIFDSKGKVVGEAKLPETLFGLSKEEVESIHGVIHQVVTAQKNYLRQGTAKTKTRAEVSGGGRKPFRQKGTGNARQGSTREPQHKGGGIVHGPTPRFYDQKINKKVFTKALSGVLSNRYNNSSVFIVSDFGLVENEPKTKNVLSLLNELEIQNKSTLLVAGLDDFDTYYSARNLKNVEVISSHQVNAFNVVSNKALVFTSKALQEFLMDEKVITEGSKK